MALQPDGRIVVAGSASNEGDIDFVLLRYLSDGTLDPSFGTDGRVFTSLGTEISYDYAYGVEVLPDGRIVAAGYSGFDFAVARYMADGSLDMAFGEGGRAKAVIPGRGQAFAMAIQPDGRVIVAGYSNGGGNGGTGAFDFVVVRFSADGVPDFTFGSNGVVSTPFLSGSIDRAYAVAVRPDGRIAVGGTTFRLNPYQDPDQAIAHYEPNGTLDAGFGSGGRVIAGRPPDSEQVVYGLALQQDGRLVAAGHTLDGVSGTSQGYLASLTRYATTGMVDSTFATNGWFAQAFAGSYSNRFNAVSALPDGRVVTAGSAGNFPGTVVLVARFTTNGTLDTSFGGDGWTTTAFGETYDYASALVVQPDGRLLVVGSAMVPMNTGAEHDIVLARYTIDGELDPTFGEDGRVITDARR